jgi:pyruvate dehydrogenase E1 component beta subunit
MMSYAEAGCAALAEAMRADSRVVALGEDVGRGGIFGQYKGLAAEFGALRVIDTPISEATIMGAAVGMALAGLKPVVEMRVADFALCAMDELVNQAAKARYMFGGQARVPLVARLPIGIWSGSAAQHGQSFEAWFAHVPGLVVVAPATPADNHALLAASIACGDPVVYMEHKELWGLKDEVAAAEAAVLGKARVVRNKRNACRRLNRPIRKLVTAQRRFNHSLCSGLRRWRGGANADASEFVFSDVRIADYKA